MAKKLSAEEALRLLDEPEKPRKRYKKKLSAKDALRELDRDPEERSALDTFSDVTDLIASGFTGGLSRKASELGEYIGEKLGTRDPSQPTAQERREAFQKESPYLATGLEIAGSMLTAGGAISGLSKAGMSPVLAETLVGGTMAGTHTAADPKSTPADIALSTGLGGLGGYVGGKLFGTPEVRKGGKVIFEKSDGLIPSTAGKFRDKFVKKSKEESFSEEILGDVVADSPGQIRGFAMLAKLFDLVKPSKSSTYKKIREDLLGDTYQKAIKAAEAKAARAGRHLTENDLKEVLEELDIDDKSILSVVGRAYEAAHDYLSESGVKINKEKFLGHLDSKLRKAMESFDEEDFRRLVSPEELQSYINQGLSEPQAFQLVKEKQIEAMLKRAEDFAFPPDNTILVAMNRTSQEMSKKLDDLNSQIAYVMNQKVDDSVKTPATGIYSRLKKFLQDKYDPKEMRMSSEAKDEVLSALERERDSLASEIKQFRDAMSDRLEESRSGWNISEALKHKRKKSGSLPPKMFKKQQPGQGDPAKFTSSVLDQEYDYAFADSVREAILDAAKDSGVQFDIPLRIGGKGGSVKGNAAEVIDTLGKMYSGALAAGSRLSSRAGAKKGSHLISSTFRGRLVGGALGGAAGGGYGYQTGGTAGAGVGALAGVFAGANVPVWSRFVNNVVRREMSVDPTVVKFPRSIKFLWQGRAGVVAKLASMVKSDDSGVIAQITKQVIDAQSPKELEGPISALLLNFPQEFEQSNFSSELQGADGNKVILSPAEKEALIKQKQRSGESNRSKFKYIQGLNKSGYPG